LTYVGNFEVSALRAAPGAIREDAIMTTRKKYEATAS